MKGRKGVLLRLAFASFGKNRRIYLPYLGICTFSMMAFFVFSLILNSDIVETLPRAAYATMLLTVGQVLLCFIMIPFFIYTNSFLIRRRKRELGLYSVLGMEKKHVAVLMVYESLLTFGAVLLAAIGLGLLFSRLLLLILLNMAGLPVSVSLHPNPVSAAEAVVFFGVVTLINLGINLAQVGKANPAELLSGARKGEKEPRGLFLWSLLGVLTLGMGYRYALVSQMDNQIFDHFFLAVLLVVAGSYFLITSGSIAVLRCLKKKKGFYYQPRHFITVSGMLYRMKRNGVGLVNICIFSTMVIITVTCTAALYLGIPRIKQFRFPYRYRLEFLENAGFGEAEESALQEGVFKLAKEVGVEIKEYQGYRSVRCTGIAKEDGFAAGGGENAADRPYTLYLLDYEEFQRLWEGQNLPSELQEGQNLSPELPESQNFSSELSESQNLPLELAEDQVLIYTSGPDYGKDRIVLNGTSYRVRGELSECSLFPKAKGNTFGGGDCALIFSSPEQVRAAAAGFGVDAGTAAVYRAELNLGGPTETGLTETSLPEGGLSGEGLPETGVPEEEASPAEARVPENDLLETGTSEAGLLEAEVFSGGELESRETAFFAGLQRLSSGLPGFASCVSFEGEVKDIESMYGGLLFIGVFFGLIFLMCLLVTMYYKQITEGFEDQKNFEVMQNVGMSDEEVRRTIRKQVWLVFFLPLAAACLHTAVGIRLVDKLMGAINFFAPELVYGSAAAVCGVFAVIYAFFYRRTARTYYHIVSRMRIDT